MSRTLIEVQEHYRSRLVLPEHSEGDSLEFRTQSGLTIARGYERVVLGGRGPYVEFLTEHMIQDSLFIPESARWRLDPSWTLRCYYWELRTRDECRVKIYYQRRTVDYADYRIGCWYVSPFELVTDRHDELVRPLAGKREDDAL